MLGLILVVLLGLYLALLLWVTRKAYRYAKREGYPTTTCLAFGLGGFLLVYLPLFWDHIPTLIAHHYYCSKEAGFTMNKTLEQWKQENPGVVEAWEKSKPTTEFINNRQVVNGRVAMETIIEPRGLLAIRRFTTLITDLQTDEVLATSVDFYGASRGLSTAQNWRDVKFWLETGSCLPENAMSTRTAFGRLLHGLRIRDY
jgi:hypothetical protein